VKDINGNWQTTPIQTTTLNPSSGSIQLIFWNLTPGTSYKVEYYISAPEFLNSYINTLLLDTLTNLVSTVLSNPTSTGFDWKVNLSQIFNSNNYIRAGVCNQPFTNGQSAVPSGIVAVNLAASSGIASTSGTITGQSAGTTYTLYGFAQAVNGLYYTVGSSASITTLSNRPAYFYWDNTKTSGNDFNISATEWNRLIQNIKDIYTYKGISSYTPTLYNVTSGNNVTAVNDFNKIKNAIGYFYNSANPASGIGIADKSAGDTIYASYLDGNYSIVAKLNGIE
jgi:hypothetical protein